MALDPLPWQTPPNGGQMSEAEYFELDERTINGKYEYLNGVARLVEGATVAHSEIAFNMLSAFREHFESGPCHACSSGVRVKINSETHSQPDYVYPDASVTCALADQQPRNTLIRSPRVLLEVLSPATAKIDRIDKRKSYQACPTIQEIILIDQFSPFVETYRRSASDTAKWDLVIYDEPEQKIVIQCLGLSLPMAKIYKGIDFDEPLDEEE